MTGCIPGILRNSDSFPLESFTSYEKTPSLKKEDSRRSEERLLSSYNAAFSPHWIVFFP